VANLTIKGIGPDVLKVLKNEAERHRRSLNQEVIARLEAKCSDGPRYLSCTRSPSESISAQGAPD
jgi:plasmid stability protein